LTLSTPPSWPQLQRQFTDYVAGDKAATRRLFLELERALRPFFLVRTRSETDTEDLLQATLLKIHFARERFDLEMSLKTWVFTIARRSLIDHWRAAPEASSPTEEPTDADTLPAHALDPALRWELNQDLMRALGTLKPDDRMIVFLYAVEGFSMAEIAESQGLTEGAVKVRAHRSYVQLRKTLGSLS
jgi:RNA polymerase sigma-70 factor (ECF subfamily)